MTSLKLFAAALACLLHESAASDLHAQQETSASPVKSAAASQLAFASVFSDHMVLQRDRKAPIWGTAAPGALVTVTIAGMHYGSTSDANGRWRVDVGPLTASNDPLEIAATSRGQALSLHDVLVGDVWLASGQSNMEMYVSMAKDAEREIAAAKWPSIRVLDVPNTAADAPASGFPSTEWKAVTPESIPSFSAVAYYFGRDLHQHLDVPIGLIACDVGATAMEAWTSREALESNPTFKARCDDSFALPVMKDDPVEYKRIKYYLDTRLFNGMIATVIPYAIRGVIWYQGESNSGRADEYVELSHIMITDWRQQWGQGDFPFLFVQLASFEGGLENWPPFREAQYRKLTIPNTAMAVAIDVGDRTDIHPKDKQTVGQRLALAARRVAYGEDIVHSGPVFKNMEVMDDTARLSFDYVGGGLNAKGELRGFEIAGVDGRFVPANATINGQSIEVRSEAVGHPTTVRYDWAAYPDGNLYNAEGLPALPFRTNPPMPD